MFTVTEWRHNATLQQERDGYEANDLSFLTVMRTGSCDYSNRLAYAVTNMAKRC